MGAAKAMGRALVGAANAFDGAAAGRRLAGWAELDAAINTLLASEGDVLVRRCRGLVRKNHWARCGEDSYVANSIASGIKPESLHPDKETRALIHRSWKQSADEMDADGRSSLYGLQAVVVREVFQAGEVLVRFRPRLPQDGLLVPLQVQIIPSEHLPRTDNRTYGGNVVRSGIEFTPFGKRVAYHLWREHPGLGALQLQRANQQVRVPAADPSGTAQVVHIYQSLRAGQDRGQPWLAPVMVTLYELDQFVDAVLVRQKLANMFVGWQRSLSQSDPIIRGLPTDQGGKPMPEGTSAANVEPGTFWDLAPGETLEFNNPPVPGTEFGTFLKVMLHAFASGVGVPYEQITWDLEGVNYSSIRAGLLEFRRRVEQFQFHVIVHQFCRPLYRRWINDAVVAGVLPKPTTPEGWRDLYSVEWRTPAWDWVDPLKDVMARKEEVRSGFSSRSAVIHERGYDPEDVDREIAADNQRADELGLVFDSDPRQTANNGAAQQTLLADQQQEGRL